MQCSCQFNGPSTAACHEDPEVTMPAGNIIWYRRMVHSLQVRLVVNRNPDAKHVVFQTRNLSAALVALMNLIFAYGAALSLPLHVLQTTQYMLLHPAQAHCHVHG